jgi:hypothetical protein
MSTASYIIHNSTGKLVDLTDSDNNPVWIGSTTVVSLTDGGYQTAVNVFGSANVIPVGTGSSITGPIGADYSANKPTLPNVGSNFAASGPYASYFLIATVPANISRNCIDIENNSGAQIAVIVDDGTASTGSIPNNATLFSIAGGTGVGSQGGSWISNFEKGRIQVYAPQTNAQVAVRTN